MAFIIILIFSLVCCPSDDLCIYQWLSVLIIRVIPRPAYIDSMWFNIMWSASATVSMNLQNKDFNQNTKITHSFLISSESPIINSFISKLLIFIFRYVFFWQITYGQVIVQTKFADFFVQNALIKVIRCSISAFIESTSLTEELLQLVADGQQTSTLLNLWCVWNR